MTNPPPPIRRVRKRDSLAFRLGFTIAVGIVITSLLATAGVLWRAFERQVDERSLEVLATAQVLATTLSQDVATASRTEIYQKLRAIRYSERISFAAVHDINGTRLANVGQQVALVRGVGDVGMMGRLQRILNPEGIVETIDIQHHGQNVGTLSVGGETPGAWDALAAELKNSAWWAVMAILIGMLIAFGQQRNIMRPVNRLTKVMAEVSSSGDLPARVNVKADGEIGVMIDSYNTMIDQVTTRDKVIASHRDTLERTVEERTHDLRIARDQAEEATEVKSRFLATMSHEIRTPMNGVLVMAELLSRSDLKAEQQGYANVIARSGQALLDLLNDVLDISKLEADHLSIEKIPTAIDDLVNDVVMLFWEQARGKGIEIVSRVHADVPAEILCDPTRIRQCLANLVGNALKFTEQGYVSVELRLENGALLLAVRDTGAGIPKDRQQAIFEAFEQADNSTARTHGGTGLGLAIVSRLAEAMGGAIVLDSEVGQGSCFTMTLPLDAAAPAIPAQFSIVPRIAFAGDDLPATMRMLKRALLEDAVSTAASEADCVLVTQAALQEGAIQNAVILWPLGAPEPRAVLESGAAVDVLSVPYTRAMLNDLLQRAGTSTYRGLKALDRVQDKTSSARYPGLRVLIVDDSDVNLQVLEDALGTFSVVPALAQDGQAALAAVADQPFDIILLDKNMPGIDGFETARRIRDIEADKAWEPSTLTLMTASLEHQSMQELSEIGFDGTLPKPFQLDELDALLSARAMMQAFDGRKSDEINAEDASNVDSPSEDVSRPDPSPPKGINGIDQDTFDMLVSLDEKRPGALARIFDRFVEAMPEALDTLETALASEDAEAVRKAAHALKSVTGSSGAFVLSEAASDLEIRAMDALENQTQLPRDEALVPHMRSVFDALRGELKKAL